MAAKADPSAHPQPSTVRSPLPSSPIAANPTHPTVYTFLATLVLLLSVSAAIILRSLVLRRRHRRMLNDAIRNGLWVPPPPGAGPLGMSVAELLRLGRKPAMWEAYVGGPGPEKQHSTLRHHEPKTEWDWDSLRPFSASYVAPPATPTPQASSGAPAVPHVHAQLSPPVAESPRRRIRLRVPGRPLPPALLPSSPPRDTQLNNAVSIPGADPASSAHKKVRVAVLIAMPRRPMESGVPLSEEEEGEEEEEEIPVVEFGVAELDLRDDTLREKVDADMGRPSGSTEADDHV